MLQTLVIQTDNEQALEAVKALARKLGLTFTSFDPDDDYTEEEEARDIAIANERKKEPTYSLAEVKRILAEDAQRIEKGVHNAL
jgi:inosine/xanthosine triphosphate pyrophosphatase family protein